MAKRNSSRNNRAKQFEADVKAMFESMGGWAQRFPDKMVWRGPDAPPLSVEGPPDLMVVHQGHAHLIECKAVKLETAKSIPFDRLKLHQKTDLLQIENAGGHGWVALLFYGTSNASKDTIALLVPINEWSRLQLVSPKKSVNIKELLELKGIRRLYWTGRTCRGVGPWTTVKPELELIES